MYRRRLEQLVSYVGYSIREIGLASSYECRANEFRANKDRLFLIMIGPDSDSSPTDVGG